MAGLDKATVRIGDAPLLDRAVMAVAGAETIVIVGPRRPVEDPGGRVVWTRERPAGSGPAAALVHALTLVRRPHVVVLAVDAPFTASAVPRLLEAVGVGAGTRDAVATRYAAEAPEAAMLVEETGRRQPLIACYVSEALRRRANGQRWIDRSVHSFVEGLRVVEVEALGAESLDCDTPDDVEKARSLAATGQGAAVARSTDVAAED